MLLRPISEYIQRDRHYGWWCLPITASPKETLLQLVLQFVAAGIHRTHLVRPDGVPVSEVSTIDILRVLLEEL